MSNVARKQLGVGSEHLRNKHKHEHLPPHDLHVGQDVMFQDATSKVVVSIYYHKPVLTTKKLQYYYKGPGQVSPIGKRKHT